MIRPKFNSIINRCINCGFDRGRKERSNKDKSIFIVKVDEIKNLQLWKSVQNKEVKSFETTLIEFVEKYYEKSLIIWTVITNDITNLPYSISWNDIDTWRINLPIY